MTFFTGQVCADGEANQVVGVGKGMRLVEVIDAPDQASFDIAPGTEVFDVEVADSEDMWGFGEVRTDVRPELCPAIVSGTKKRKGRRLHRFLPLLFRAALPRA